MRTDFKFNIFQLTLEEALLAVAHGGLVYMINLDNFEDITDVKYKSVGELLITYAEHNVVFINIKEEVF